VNNSTTPTFNQVAAICSGATLAALPSTSNNAINGSWTPAINNTATTLYTFTPNAGQCAANATMTIAVNNNVVPVFTQIPSICLGQQLLALPTSSNNSILGTWTPAINSTTTTTYNFVPSTGSCAYPTNMTIFVNPTPTLVINHPAPVCEPDVVDLTTTSVINGSTIGGSISYWYNSGATQNLSNPNTINTSGTYYIQNTYQGCSSIMPVNVVVNNSPLASFNSSSLTITNENPTIAFTNTSFGAVSYHWDFGDGQSSTSPNPINTYEIINQESFFITLTATSEFGCTDVLMQEIATEEELIYYVPNTFTPADDRYNPTFTPVFTSGIDPSSYRISIFNRWGEAIFESNDVEVGWDGNHSKTNQIVGDGTYSWKISFTLKNSPKKEVIYGQITLLK
jgi:gliding motility-associated-like protein